ncbi:MAG: response regulator [Anaeromyxobacteraceae bacterium]
MTGKILVVDDDPTHLMYTQEILEADGHDVVVHRTGFGVSVKFWKEKPDLVLLDVNMPGLSGENVCFLLERWLADRKTPVLLYSSNDEESLRKTAQKLGTAGYVMKGDPTQLRSSVRRALDARARLSD